MGRKEKFSFKTKLDIVLWCLKGQIAANYEAKMLGINHARESEWISLYQLLGEDGLISTSKNTAFSTDIKINAVLDYLIGKKLYATICKKTEFVFLVNYEIGFWSIMTMRSSGDQNRGTPIITKGRKTTFEERIEIV